MTRSVSYGSGTAVVLSTRLSSREFMMTCPPPFCHRKKSSRLNYPPHFLMSNGFHGGIVIHIFRERTKETKKTAETGIGMAEWLISVDDLIDPHREFLGDHKFGRGDTLSSTTIKGWTRLLSWIDKRRSSPYSRLNWTCHMSPGHSRRARPSIVNTLAAFD